LPFPDSVLPTTIISSGLSRTRVTWRAQKNETERLLVLRHIGRFSVLFVLEGCRSLRKTLIRILFPVSTCLKKLSASSTAYRDPFEDEKENQIRELFGITSGKSVARRLRCCSSLTKVYIPRKRLTWMHCWS
jgi:hypothetical protein